MLPPNQVYPDKSVADAAEAADDIEPEAETRAQKNKGTRELTPSVTTPAVKACFQLSTFIVSNIIIIIFLFVWPRLTTYMYLSHVTDKGTCKYSYIPTTVPVPVDDTPEAKGKASYLAAYRSLVNIPSDVHGNPGWNLQDILGMPRAKNKANQCCEGVALLRFQRMVQDYRLCAGTCVDASGLPLDYYNTVTGLPKRDYRAKPYGVLGTDFYANRNAFLEAFDYDFYHMFLSNNGSGHPDKASLGNFGLGNFSGSLEDSSPTDLGYLCNLGQRRRIVSNITIKSEACHVQIVSQEGDGYSLFVRLLHRQGLSVPSVDSVVDKDVRSGCRREAMTIELSNPFCNRQQPGASIGCQEECAAILFKGVDARRIPIQVDSTLSLDDMAGAKLRIDDQYLVLDPWGRNKSAALTVSGAQFQVELSNARIASINASMQTGLFSLDHVRSDTIIVQSQTDDVSLRDNRNYELQYRSAGQYLCLSGPLVEQIPSDFMPCDMAPEGTPTAAVHLFYDTIPDGYIDRNEFAAGLDKLGIDYLSDSLNLNAAAQKRLLDHVFRYTLPESEVQSLPYDVFQEQLQILMPPFTTLYDSSVKKQCMDACVARGTAYWQCQERCTWQCTVNITDATYGGCDPMQGCLPLCGAADTSISGQATAQVGQIDYKYYDVDPPDGIVTYEEMRQGLLKIYSNCTYVIEPYQKDYATCLYIGGGVYDMMNPGESRRECTTYSTADRLKQGLTPFDKNPPDWRTNNTNLPDVATAMWQSTRPRECRPFPDYDPRLNGRQYNPAANQKDCPECFLPDGSRVPPQYYNRSTWAVNNYNTAMLNIRSIFGTSKSFAYFNISNDDQYRKFASKMFAATTVRDRVPYQTFNYNMQTLSQVEGIGANFYLFNPRCYNGMFMKTGPADYTNMTSGGVADYAIAKSPLNPSVVTNSNMPGYKAVSAASNTTVNACPPDWGTGKQGSTSFSYFAWADSSVGYKWGRALPEFCLDEAWPNGGVDGKYINDPVRYGSLAGQPIRPGCEPAACKPLIKVDVWQGSIHAQVLPFEFDFRNPYGSYNNMVQNCVDSTGTSQCFYKGYANKLDMRLRRADVSRFDVVKTTYGPPESTEDALAIMDVSGFGLPNFGRWFWTSRSVYMQMEPAWLSVFSGGVLGPKLVYINARITPGLCDMQYGAVEDLDWRDNSSWGYSAAGEGLRLARQMRVYQTLYQALQPDTEPDLRGNFYLKNVWRTPYKNESLMFNPVTFDAISDTNPGYKDAAGAVQTAGPSFRHRRACASDQPCDEIYAAYPDNCRVPRTLEKLPNNSYVLTPCANKDGSSAFVDPVLGEASPSINESAYFRQFGRQLAQYPWEEVATLHGNRVLNRNWMASWLNPVIGNITRLTYDKLRIFLGDAGNVRYENASGAWSKNMALVGAIMISFMISASCGLGVAAALVYIGTSTLIKYNEQRANEEKVKEGLKLAKLAQYLEIVAVEWKYERRQYAQGRVNAWIKKSPPGRLEEMLSLKISKFDDLESSLFMAMLPEGLRGTVYDALRLLIGDQNFERLLRMSQQPLEVPAEVRNDAEVFAKTHGGWTPESDVSLWNIEAMKVNYRAFQDQRSSERKALKPSKSMVSSGFKFITQVGAKAAAGANKYMDLEKHQKLLEVKKKLKKAAEVRRKLQRLANKNKLLAAIIQLVMFILRRFYHIVQQIFFGEYPSPFDVVNMLVINQVKIRLINSVKTFVKECCLTDMVLDQCTEMRLGGTLEEMNAYEDKRLADLEDQEAEREAGRHRKGGKGGEERRRRRRHTIHAAGVGGEVTRSRNVLGTSVRYKVKWVQVWVEDDDFLLDGETPSKVPVVHIMEGPRVTEVTLPGGLGVDPATLGGRTTQEENATSAAGMRRDSNRVHQEGVDEVLKRYEGNRHWRLRTPVDRDESGVGGERVFYLVEGPGGPRTITINTHGNMQINDLDPRVEFRMCLHQFAPAYEKFCMDYGLIQKDVLKCSAALASRGVTLSKRIVTLLKGARPKTIDDRLAEAAQKTKEEAKAHKPSRAKEDSTGLLTISIPVGLRMANGEVEQIRVDTALKLPTSSFAHLKRQPERAALPLPAPEQPQPRESGGGGSSGRDPAAAPDIQPWRPSAGGGSGGNGRDAHGVDESTPLLKAEPEARASTSGLRSGASLPALRGSLSGFLGTQVSGMAMLEEEEEEEAPPPPVPASMVALQESDMQFAKFLREEYIVTSNFVQDVQDWGDVTAKYKAWCKASEVEPDLHSFDAEDELWQFGVRYQELAIHDMSGVLVNERDLEVNTESSNLQIWFLMQVLTVWLHMLLLWLPPWPLIQVVFMHQSLYAATTSIQPQLTTEYLRVHPGRSFSISISGGNRAVLFCCLYWLFFTNIKLVIYYLGIAIPRLSRNWFRTVIKSLFWLYLLLVICMVVSYVFLIFCWLILGAIIKPDAFLPYCVGAITLLAHAKATATRLKVGFNKYQAVLAATVAAAFAAKIAATLAMGKKKAKGDALDTSDPSKLEPYPVFKMYAGENDDLSYEEFSALLDRFDIDMIEDKRRLFFAKVDLDGSGAIGYNEFQSAWQQIQEAIVEQQMRESGMTQGRLVLLFLYAVSVLLMVFAFIFVGVGAFLGAGTFGAVVNSVLTAGSGLAMNIGKATKENKDEEAEVEAL